jgi:glycosyltransferase involved in cell wall biosynthesis
MHVTVIIRAYNRAYIIKDAIASALAQTHKDMDVLVVDDASTDNTQQIVEALGDPRISYVRHSQNRGVSGAANTGIKTAKGDATALLDSDDLWKPDMLETLAGFLERHESAGAVFCDIEVRRKDDVIPSLAKETPGFQTLLSRSEQRGEYLFDQREMYLCLIESLPIKPTAMVVRRAVFDEIGGFNEKLRSAEDWDMYLRMSKAVRIGYVDRVLATQREQKDSTFFKYRERDKQTLLAIARGEKRGSAGDAEAVRIINRAIHQHSKVLAGIYRRNGKRLQSFKTSLDGFMDTKKPDLLARAVASLLPLPV